MQKVCWQQRADRQKSRFVHRTFLPGLCGNGSLLRKAELCKLEFIGDDIYQIMAKYLEIDGNPYVMELLKKMDKNSLIDRKDHERTINSLTGYNERLYRCSYEGIQQTLL